MTNMKYVIFILLLLSYSLNCSAAIYKQEDKRGNVVYSDTPLNSDAQKIDLPAKQDLLSQSLQVMPTPAINNVPPSGNGAVPAQGDAAGDIAGTAKAYTVFQITSPKDQESIQNQPVLSVSVRIEPELQKDDKVQIIADGKPVGTAQHSTTLTIDKLERGSHQLSAVILDANQNVLKQANVITIFVHQMSTNFKPTSTKLQKSNSFFSPVKNLLNQLFS